MEAPIRVGLDHVDEYAAAASWFGETLVEAPARATVPACPGWRVLDLALHLGNVHAWAASIVETGRPCPEPTDRPRRRRDLAQWYLGKAEDLFRALQAVPPERPCWNFAYGDGVAAFWSRRQLHETLIHGVDLAQAIGIESRLPAALAADGVDEALRVFGKRMHDRGHVAALTAPLVLVASDVGRAWRLTRAPDQQGPPIVRDLAVREIDPAEDRLEAPAAELDLLLWKRTRCDDLAPGVPAQGVTVQGIAVQRASVQGDAVRIQAFLASRLTA